VFRLYSGDGDRLRLSFPVQSFGCHPLRHAKISSGESLSVGTNSGEAGVCHWLVGTPERRSNRVDWGILATVGCGDDGQMPRVE
jgi:hypothetical protein